MEGPVVALQLAAAHAKGDVLLTPVARAIALLSGIRSLQRVAFIVVLSDPWGERGRIVMVDCETQVASDIGQFLLDIFDQRVRTLTLYSFVLLRRASAMIPDDVRPLRGHTFSALGTHSGSIEVSCCTCARVRISVGKSCV